ncbi:hypothetical protein PAXINDRAFT_103817 [Paxillus involutus ATCC 200175]|uniref:Uncharacterized protein n=1 Tax=Paxillus involutus ATCC 200175 TaxID=664439 RepID=A0A0C9T1C3_PAXIN|nr:hypothetical protein PAXINDRAFT_103817 [Paxillus involutus ATCC 200175]
MVFSEGYNVAEELSKGEPVSEAHGGSPLSASVTVEPEPFASEQPWPENEMRSEEDLVDEDIDVARTESTAAGPVSPPVAELLLIPLEEPSDATLPSEPAVSNATEELIHLPQDPAPEASTVHEATPEELGEPAPAEPIESQPAEEPCVSTSTSDAAEVATQEEENADVSEPSPELSENPPPKQDEAPAGSSTEEDSSAPSSTDEDTEDAEQRREPEAPLPNEYLLDLSEPPPSEPIPPESESDITDEVNELDVDEVRESGGDGEVTGE